MQVVKSSMLLDQEQAIKENKQRSVLGFLGIGKALDIINRNDLWRFSEAKSFVEYCEKVQGFKKTWAYGLVGVYQKFSDILLSHDELKMIDPTRCVRLLPYVNEDNIEELTHMAATVPFKDFDANLRNLQNKQAPDQCDHIFHLIPYKICDKCGLKVKIKNGDKIDEMVASEV